VTLILQFLCSEAALIRALPASARVAIAIFFLAGLADGVLMPFFAIWAQQEARIPTLTIGPLLACYAGGELLATPLVGGIADRVGRRPVLLISASGIGLGFLLLYFAQGAPAVAAILLLIGGFESVLHPTAATVIADLAPADQLRAHYALTRIASNAGHVVGPAMGAVLVQRSLGLVFVGSSMAMVVAATLVATSLRETKAADSRTDDDDNDIVALLTLFRDRNLAALLLPVAILGIASSWVESVLPEQNGAIRHPVTLETGT
jgi:DHA1 family tetracycline resistance protein-like MFS transporter